MTLTLKNILLWDQYLISKQDIVHCSDIMIIFIEIKNLQNYKLNRKHGEKK